MILKDDLIIHNDVCVRVKRDAYESFLLLFIDAIMAEILPNLSFGFFWHLGCVKAPGIKDQQRGNINKYGPAVDL